MRFTNNGRYEKMKKLLICAAIIAAGAVHAELKFATVDMLKLMRNHPDYDRNERLLESTDKDYQKKVDSIKSEGEALQAEGRKLMEQSTSPILNEKAKADIAKKIADIQQKLYAIEQRYRAEAMRCHQDLQELRQRLMKTTADDLKERVRKFSELKGYDIIIDSNATAYSKPSLDVTDAVLSDMGIDPAKAKGANEGK